MTATNQDLRAAISPAMTANGVNSSWTAMVNRLRASMPMSRMMTTTPSRRSPPQAEKFSQSPALYYREYVSKLKRAKAASTANAFTAGSSHPRAGAGTRAL